MFHYTHVYYRCGNNHRKPDHPKVRWREDDVEEAVVKELDSIRFPLPEEAQWFRDSISAAFENVSYTQSQQRKMLTKRKTELANMQDRLLNGYLAGAIDEAAFQSKLADLKRETEEKEIQLTEVSNFDPACVQIARSVFEFSQNLAEIWRGSNFAEKRDILECVSLNRTLGDVSLYLVKRKPFDFLAERPFLRKNSPNGI